MDEIQNVLLNIISETSLSIQDAIEICEIFFSNFSAKKKTIEECILKEDYAAIGKFVHQFKGTVSNIRMSHIYDLALDLGEAAKNKDGQKCCEIFANISLLVDSIEQQVAVYKNEMKLNVLIVEDDLVSGKMIESTIKRLGHYSLGIASTAEQAFIQVRKQKPDLIFMDINLSSEMDGIFIAELLQNYCSTYIVFISIHADPKTISFAKQYGVGYIIKPYTAKEIADTIDTIISKKINLQYFKTTPVAHIKVKQDNQILFVDYEDVIYFEAQAHDISIFTSTKSYVIRSSLKEIMANDEKKLFVKVHRSFLVNRNKIESLQHTEYFYEIKLIGCSKMIPVSSKYIQSIKKPD